MGKKVNIQFNRATKKVANLEEAFAPLLWLNRVVSTAVFEMPVGQYWMKLSIFFAISKLLIFSAITWYVLKHLPAHSNSFPVVLGVYEFIHYVNITISILSIIFGFINYKTLKGFFKKVRLADETLEIFGIDPEYDVTYKENLRTVVVWIITGITIIAINYAISVYTLGGSIHIFFRLFIFEFPLLLNSVAELNFVLKIAALGKRFERLNALIQNVASSPIQTVDSGPFSKYQNIIKTNQNKIIVKPLFYYKNRNNIELLLKVTRQLHLDLCTTAREVNDGCSKLLSMQMGAIFILLTGFSYCMYITYNDSSIETLRKMQQYCSRSIWIVVAICRMIYLVRTSVNVATEAQKTSQIAHEIQVSRTQNKLIDEIHQLSLQIMQHPLYFTASGLIVLDFGYIRGFVGSVTTYLMILIQNQPDMLKAANALAENSANDTNKTSASSLQ